MDLFKQGMSRINAAYWDVSSWSAVLHINTAQTDPSKIAKKEITLKNLETLDMNGFTYAMVI